MTVKKRRQSDTFLLSCASCTVFVCVLVCVFVCVCGAQVEGMFHTSEPIGLPQKAKQIVKS